MNKCFKSYPVLSLRKVPSMSITSPFAKTASRPVTSQDKQVYEKKSKERDSTVFERCKNI